ncbi:hypothetical protein ASU31_18880 [Pedobacter ginsenosidimutans]|uniref:Uncharacterized protein n=1 Tax=Pedobacter ginsenosidimutans TaxID=687842 RepID=A0A0T5VKT3_9SPHI|nr:hypothetical protein ASU31_18880 [Pedobacter ginsenosidimutans]
MELIQLLNNKLGHKKTGVKTFKSDYSSQVLKDIVSNREFAKWLQIIAYIPMNLEPMPESYGNIVRNRQIF